MHVHSFKEITQQFDYETIGFQKDEILHIFECICGFTLIEKKRPIKSNFRRKKMTIYTVLRKSDPNSARPLHTFSNLITKTGESRV